MIVVYWVVGRDLSLLKKNVIGGTYGEIFGGFPLPELKFRLSLFLTGGFKQLMKLVYVFAFSSVQ